jgi:hypothetical protein
VNLHNAFLQVDSSAMLQYYHLAFQYYHIDNFANFIENFIILKRTHKILDLSQKYSKSENQHEMIVFLSSGITQPSLSENSILITHVLFSSLFICVPSPPSVRVDNRGSGTCMFYLLNWVKYDY